MNRRLLEPDEVQVVENFDLNRYMGGWYVYSRTENWAEKGFKCSKDTYVLKPDGKITVTYTAERDYPFFWKPFKLSLEGEVLDPTQPAKQRYGFRSGPPNYFVLATDYDNYAAVYAPMSFLFNQIRLYHAGVLVRDRNGPANRELLQTAYEAIERCGISREELVKIKQDCTSN